MSFGKIVGFLIRTIIIIVVGLGIYCLSIPVTYEGNTISLNATSGMYLDVYTEGTVQINAISSEYFRLIQGETHLYGIPETPPLDYKGNEYFVLKGEVEKARYLVKDGNNITFKFIGESEFSIIRSHTKTGIWIRVVAGLFLAILLLYSNNIPLLTPRNGR